MASSVVCYVESAPVACAGLLQQVASGRACFLFSNGERACCVVGGEDDTAEAVLRVAGELSDVVDPQGAAP